MKVKNIYDNTILLFTAFLITGFLLLTLHFKEGERGILHQLQGWSQAIVTPLVSVTSQVGSAGSGFISAFQNLKQMKEENSRLKAANQELEGKLSDLKSLQSENTRLKKALDYQEREIKETVFARVIASSILSRERTIIIDRGSRAGIKKDLPVVNSAGLIGTVAKVYPYSALVRLITDARSGISVRVLETREVGVLEGSPSGKLFLRYLPYDTKIRKGDTLQTSGLGGKFPAGIFSGIVEETAGTISGPERIESVGSKVDFDKLEEVFVLLIKESDGSR